MPDDDDTNPLPTYFNLLRGAFAAYERQNLFDADDSAREEYADLVTECDLAQLELINFIEQRGDAVVFAMRRRPALCHCGRPLHYSDPTARRLVERLVADLGPDMEVVAGGRTWLVPRHYIALHGLRAAEIPELGFKERPRA